MARYLSVFITHTPPPPLVERQSACVRPADSLSQLSTHSGLAARHQSSIVGSMLVRPFFYSSVDETFWKAALHGDLDETRSKISHRCCQACGASETILIPRSTTTKKRDARKHGRCFSLMDNMSVCFAPMCRWQVATQRAHTHAHTYARIVTHDSITHIHTPFTHFPSTYICCTRRSFTISFLFLHAPSHLYLSFAAYWKKLTCGVIGSFDFLQVFLLQVSCDFAKSVQILGYLDVNQSKTL